ncbi:hypothetical protein [Alkalimarinus coralli]|uniref:hypothetical protein n=1 Tax=Alkalimarinus coralli TaxID=2935863 RepID=UPI00202ADD02|nr:hypothetical protein [Alkalimarinus coralli]
MKKLFWGIVFVAVALLVSFKGYLWFQVYKQLADIKEQVAPFAAVKYGWIYSTFDGEVGVRDISITPYLLKGTISIDEVSLKAKDAAALFKLGDKLEQRIPPDQLLVKITNMSFPLDGNFDEFIGASADTESTTVFNPFGVYGCGDTVVVEADELRAMGYDQFTVSSEMGYQYDALSKELSIRALVDSDSMGHSEFLVDLGVSGNDLYDVVGTQQVPEIKSAVWSFNDGGYFRRLSFYCGKKTETERKRYVEYATQEWDADLKDHGVHLNPSLIEAYRQYILDGGLLNVEVRPDRGIDYTSLSLFSANDIVNMLNLRIKLNGELLEDLSLTIDETTFGDARQQTETLPSQQSAASEQPDLKPLEKSFKESEIEEAEMFLKRRALVETDSGKTIEGVIISVDEHVIEVEQIVAGGKVSYPLRKRNITSFKVWK